MSIVGKSTYPPPCAIGAGDALVWTLNLIVHDCDDAQPFSYLWFESLARTGGNEIGSCIFTI
nr:unnamed protein product [Callosobruchus analis]